LSGRVLTLGLVIVIEPGRKARVVGVEQWAEIRRLHGVERLSIQEISRRTGLHRKTVRRALAATVPPRYSRPVAVSKVDPFKDWICEQLVADPGIASQRLRELAGEIGYEGGKSIFDDYVREVRPRFLVVRAFQRTIYRPGELVQCDLWVPRDHVPVGHGQQRRGWVVTCEASWSRVIAGTLIFSKEAPDILWGLGRNLTRLGALPEKLVWDRESAIAAGGRPTSPFAGIPPILRSPEHLRRKRRWKDGLECRNRSRRIRRSSGVRRSSWSVPVVRSRMSPRRWGCLGSRCVTGCARSSLIARSAMTD
jgi:hypothetical protein